MLLCFTSLLLFSHMIELHPTRAAIVLRTVHIELIEFHVPSWGMLLGLLLLILVRCGGTDGVAGPVIV